MNRRHFLMSTAVMAGSAAVKGFAQSPNERVRIAVIGLGGRGGSHVNAWSRMANVEIAGICDIDESHIGEKFKLLESRGVKSPTTFVDFRKILDDKSIDAVSIATPNHWHTLMTVLACQAGKDVYVEKPCSHNVFESQQIIAAARSAFLDGDTRAYSAAIGIVLIGAALVFFVFPKHDAETALLERYAAEDAEAG